VKHRLTADSVIERTGRVIRLVTELDPQTRRAQLLVSVSNPFRSDDDRLPLLPGAFVEVEIVGRGLIDVFRLPRSALFNGDSVWIVNEKLTLERRTVRVQWRDAEYVFVGGRLAAGEKYVTTRLSGPINGMTVRIVAEAQPATSEVVADEH
jgi:hypothetical protein